MLFLSRCRSSDPESPVKIVGTDPVEMTGAAQEVGATVNTTRHGIGWFQCPQSQVYKVRERFTLVHAPFLIWMEHARGNKLVNPLTGQLKSGTESTGTTTVLGPEFASAGDYFGVVPCDDAKPGPSDVGPVGPG